MPEPCLLIRKFQTYQNRLKLLQIKFEELIIKLGRSISGAEVPVLDSQTKNNFFYLRCKVFSSLADGWTVEKMAKELGFSKSRFISIYKSIYGISPYADLINSRIKNAKDMLISDNKSIKEIAVSLGYDNTTHFIRQFKSKTGLSPGQYRKLEHEYQSELKNND